MITFSQYRLLENVIYVEVVLVLILIIVTFILKFYFQRQNSNNENLKKNIDTYFRSLINSQNDVNTANIPDSWRKLELILPVIYGIDKTDNTSRWNSLRESITRTVLLPIARKKYSSRSWLNRLLSAQCFEIAMDDEDEGHVCVLMDDKIPLVHLYAITAGINRGTISMINMVINYVAQKRRLGQSVYLRLFKNAKPEVAGYVEDRLKTEVDPFTRATCYKILLSFPPNHSNIETTNDLNASNIELRLAAIRYTVHRYQNESIELLSQLISDNNWEVRSVSLLLLGKLNSKNLIGQITQCLRDPVWWVRLNAAITLKNLGPAGIEVLSTLDPKTDLYAYETAMHVLNAPNFENKE